ncbi:MAG: hypothetical protein JWO70_3102 [Betaproteobacteria bacterium]|nr:hypothetical protein [Betaproteobacteria bacterium]
MTRGSPEAWLLALVCAALIAARVYPELAPILDSDAFQYLSMAKNALAGFFAHTSIAHFDAERSFGFIPAPVVTFPAGYPLAIALVSQAGLSLHSAALLISAASTVVCVFLLAWIAQRLGIARGLRIVLLVTFVSNAAVVYYAACALTEALFTALVTAAVALLVAARARGRAWYWIAAGLVFGIAYFVRYAGLFFVVGLGIVALLHVIARERSVAKGYILACAAAGALVAAGMARNILIVGNWRGGNEKVIGSSLSTVLVETVRAMNGVFLGPGSALHGGTLIARALCAALFTLGTVWLAWRYLRQRRAADGPFQAGHGFGIDLLLLALTYGACMFYAGLTTVISYEARMFVPLVPLIILLVGLVLQAFMADRQSARPARIPIFALLASACLYLFLNVPASLKATDGPTSASALVGWGPGEEKAVLRTVTARAAKPVIVANNGQAVGYLLDLPTVSMVGPYYSSVEWNEKTLRDTIQRFNASAVVISIPQGRATDDVPSAFVHKLAAGDAPQWLEPAYQSGAVRVYTPRLTPLISARPAVSAP